MADVREREALLGKPGLQRVDGGRRAAVEERRPVVCVEKVGGDRAGIPLVQQVDRLLHGSEHYVRSRASSRIAAASLRLPQPRVSVRFVGSRSL